jgi:hypothetical protein
VTCRSVFAKIFNRGIHIAGRFRLELKSGRVLVVDGNATVIDAFLCKDVKQEATQRILAHPADPTHPEAQPGQSNGDVEFGAGRTPGEFFDLTQVPGLFGNKHDHCLSKSHNVELAHRLNPLL